MELKVKNFLVPAMLSVIMVVSICYGESNETSNSYKFSKELTIYLAKHFGNCKIVELNDYGVDTLRFFTPTYQVTGDFDGNGLEDMCTIIKCNESYKVISFHKNNNSFEHYVLESVEKFIRSTLAVEGPGPVIISTADEEKKEKKINTNAIRIDWIESCNENIFIWNKRKYVSYYRGL